MSVEFLRNLTLFADLSDEDLNKLYEMAEPLTVKAGEYLLHEGTTGDEVYVVLDGAFAISKRSGQQEVLIAECATGEVLGEISMLEQAPRTASARALRESRVLRISGDSFTRFLTSSPTAVISVLHTVMGRLRNTESMLLQHEKMASLGTLAAGIAHELNNPAAAVVRSSHQLREALDAWQQSTLQIAGPPASDEAIDAVRQMGGEVKRRAAAPPTLDPLECSDLQADLQEWLEAREVENAWELAPALVGLGWDAESLAAEVAGLSEDQARTVIQWLGSASLVNALLAEVATGAARISEIVKAVKTYSYVDRAPVQRVDVHEGLENTLVILHHKLKMGIDIRREYAPNLPVIEAYAGELNQVWTNLIDNAIDAMGGKGQILLRTQPLDGHVVVEIVDNGPGIPPEIQARIFDPFFTTKEAGIGTGLGLHIVHNIVVMKHNGQINVTSEPGGTTFRVTLPVELRAGQPGEPEPAGEGEASDGMS